MLISHSHKFIFIKTKKTAGSTIESIIVNNFFDREQDVCTGSKIDGTPRINIGLKRAGEPDGHKAWSHIMPMLNEEQRKEYFRFTVERNPWEKMVSEFYWKQSTDPELNVYNDDCDNFEVFMSKKLGTIYIPPIDWSLYSNGMNVVVDKIIQFRSLKTELIELFNEQFNLPLTEEIVESTRMKSGFRKKHYTELYRNRDLVDKVSRLFHKEIKYFKYEFGE